MATKPFTPTPEQTEAIGHDGDTLVLRASAGTGKTATLVLRYLRHVREDGLRPDQILTLTFTRKAAAEMKLRIVGALADAGLREEAQVAETGPIQTIHGFCERVLRECSVEAGLDPDFEVLDETDAGRRLTDAIKLAIAEIEGVPLAEALMERLAGRPRYLSLAPHGAIEEALRGIVRTLRGSTLRLEDLERNYADPDRVLEHWKQLMIDDAPVAVREALASHEPGLPFGVRLKRAYRGIREGVPKGLPSESNAAEVATLDRQCAEDSCGLVQLACRTWRAFEAANAASGSLDFVELEQRTVDLLQSHEPALRRLQRQYRAALIDESQDLNPIQHRLIDVLAPKRLLFVGDAQQSIYSFRQADVGLFRERAGSSPTLPLTKNQRSREGILHFVDALFGELWKGEYLPMADSPPPSATDFPGVELWIQKAKDTGRIAEWVRELAAEGEPLGDIAVLVRSGAYAQALLARLDELEVPARIAGGSERYYLRLEVRDMANVLAALGDPHDDFALLAVLNSPVASLSMDSIVLLAQGGGVRDKLASFEPPDMADRERLAQFRAWFEPLSRYADRLPAWELLSAVYAQSPYFATVARRPRGVQTLANVRKLLVIAAGMPGEDARSFARRLREIRELRHHEGDAPAGEDERNQVTIMTIHKAKGLEFDVVVVPETLTRERPMGELEIDKRKGMITFKVDTGGSMFHQFNAGLRKARDREEELRLLYVAMTRAKRRLCVVANPGGKNTTLGGLIPETLGWGEGIPAGVKVREAGGQSEPSAESGPDADSDRP